MNGPLRIGALARASGISVDSLRHYERIGVVATPGRTAGGFREYPVEALRRVRVVQGALALGFSLGELAGIFRERAAGRAPCRRVRELAGEKLRALDRDIAERRRLRRGLARTLAAWDARLARTEPGRPAGLLDALADLQPVPRVPRPLARKRATKGRA